MKLVHVRLKRISVQFSSVTQLCLTLCDPMNCSTPGLPVITNSQSSPCWIIQKAKEFQKNIYFSIIDYTKAFDYVDHIKLWKIL